MLTNPSPAEPRVEPALAELSRLRRFTGPAGEFWPAFLAASARLIQASRGILIVRDSNQPERLKKLGDWTENGHADRSTVAFNRLLPELTEKSIQQGQHVEPLESVASGPRPFAVAVCLQLQASNEKCVAAFLLQSVTEAQAREAVVRLQLTADMPVAYQMNHAALQARSDVEKFASVLDVMVLVNAEKRFLAAALAFCNGLATRFQCDRVSLGWLEKGYVRLKTISHTERFDKNMSAVKSLETVMEESLDQDEEILWPAAAGVSLITKDHELFAREQGVSNVCSLPLRLDDKGTAVLTCERQARPFSAVEVQQLRLACDQAVRRLADLKVQDRWFGARWATQTREKLSKVLGPEHTWAKVFAVLGTVALVVCLLPIFSYRVEGNFIVRSDEVSFLSSPFDGYIRAVEVRPGDVVTNGAALLRLNTDDLELEEAGAVADQNRDLREAEKSRATKQLAEMRIAQALAEQAQAHLDMVRYRLNQAVIASPFNGVVVEGDLRQRIGAPVKKGDALFKVARLDTLYVEAEVNERDVHEILSKGSGEIAFVTQPKLKFPVRITRVEPAAFPKEGQNVFLVRCTFEQKPEAWWRPGMSGVCKVAVEDRSLLWIFTHRTVDFLRMFFWW
jgi:multidrug resistance efflux pump